jgi:hypothetical protein
MEVFLSILADAAAHKGDLRHPPPPSSMLIVVEYPNPSSSNPKPNQGQGRDAVCWRCAATWIEPTTSGPRGSQKLERFPRSAQGVPKRDHNFAAVDEAEGHARWKGDRRDDEEGGDAADVAAAEAWKCEGFDGDAGWVRAC